jgi:hypothetical protein
MVLINVDLYRLSFINVDLYIRTRSFSFLFFFCAPGIWDWQVTRTGTLQAAFCKHDWEQKFETKLIKSHQTHHRSCSRLGDARVSALRTIVREPYCTALTPHEASGWSFTT